LGLFASFGGVSARAGASAGTGGGGKWKVGGGVVINNESGGGSGDELANVLSRFGPAFASQ
jgi:hypothetical protein